MYASAQVHAHTSAVTSATVQSIVREVINVISVTIPPDRQLVVDHAIANIDDVVSHVPSDVIVST